MTITHSTILQNQNCMDAKQIKACRCKLNTSLLSNGIPVRDFFLLCDTFLTDRQDEFEPLAEDGSSMSSAITSLQISSSVNFSLNHPIFLDTRVLWDEALTQHLN